MRELVYYIAVSLDGYIASPDGRFDAFSMDGDHMADLARFPDALPTAAAAEHLGIPQSGAMFDTVLMGANTYAVGLPDGVVSPYRHLRQIVFSRSRRAEAENLEVTAADPAAVVRELKDQPGSGIWLCGGGNLAGQLVDQIDRVVFKRHPVLFGGGIPAFAPGGYAPSAFEVVGTRNFDSGVAVTEYARPGLSL